MRTPPFIAFALLSASLIGCPTVGENFRSQALARASFEMQCPREQLQLTGLNRSLDDGMNPGAQVGVTGCGRRAVYVAAYGAGWVMNTGNTDSGNSSGGSNGNGSSGNSSNGPR